MQKIKEIFGLNLAMLDISLKVMYNNMNDSGNQNTLNSKENQKFSTIDIFVCDEILEIINNDKENAFLGDDQSFLLEIDKILKLHRSYKVILKFDYLKLDKINKYFQNDIDEKDVFYGNNVIAVVEPNVNKPVLEGFFKKYNEYINFRNVIEGKIKNDYYSICKLVFFNGNIYEFDSDLNFSKTEVEYVK